MSYPYPYMTYPDNLGMAALDPNGSPVYQEDPNLIQMLLTSAQIPNKVDVYATNPAQALYVSGDRGLFTASPFTNQCDTKCLGTCPDPRLRIVKPLYQGYRPQGGPTIYQTNGMY